MSSNGIEEEILSEICSVTQDVSMMCVVLLQLKNTLWGRNILLYWASPHVLKYTHNLFPNETCINCPMNVFTMPTAHCYHLPQSAQLQLVCVCLSCTIPRYVLPFQEVIDWGKAALVMDERAVFQVRDWCSVRYCMKCGVHCLLTANISRHTCLSELCTPHLTLA